MNLWLLLLAWAVCLACAAPLDESGALAGDGGAAAAGVVACRGEAWTGAKDKIYTHKPAQMSDDTLSAGTFHPDHENPALTSRSTDEPSNEGDTEGPEQIFWERIGMDNDTEHGINVPASAANASDVAVGSVGAALDPKYSLQILMFTQDGQKSWFMYQGPYGIAVNPCTGDGFRTIVTKYHQRWDADFNNPPYVSPGAKWDVDFQGGPNCWYESRKDDPGHLICDGGLDLTFKKDAGNQGNEKGTFHCWKTRGVKTTHWWFHPAWVLEYGGSSAAEANERSVPENLSPRSVASNSIADSAIITRSEVDMQSTPKHSLQILLFEQDGRHSWFMYQGPYGIPVDPCGGSTPQFRAIVEKYPEGRALDFNNPPFVSDGVTWQVNTDIHPDCKYESQADNPGVLNCGEWVYFFAKDAGNNADGKIRCSKPSGRGKKYWFFHRAWVLEYGAANKADIAIRSTPTHSLEEAETDLQSSPTSSIQILLFEQDGRHSWFIYMGPYNVPVNPCIDGGGPGFTLLVDHYPENRQLDFMNPPYIKAGYVRLVPIDNHYGCVYITMPDNPGILSCGGDGGGLREYPFYKDAGNNDREKIHCKRNEGLETVHWWFHRAWVLEYHSPPKTVEGNGTEGLVARDNMSNITEPGMNASSSTIRESAITEPRWKNSLQILLFKQFGHHSWFMFQGPSGVAVNPCHPDPFQLVVKGSHEDRQVDFHNPPFVKEGTKWDVNMGAWSDRGPCRFEAGADDPGHLLCGDFLDYPFSKDAGNIESEVITCYKREGDVKNYWYFHRAWVLEY